VCARNALPPRLIPHDVTTQWNSTYDMLKVAVAYCAAIDDITADKSVKLRKYELDEEVLRQWVLTWIERSMIC
jgi:hypothetical protein